jgi:hypothetical protein
MYLHTHICIYACILFGLFLLDEKKTKTALKQNIPDTIKQNIPDTIKQNIPDTTKQNMPNTIKQSFPQDLNIAKISTKSFHLPTAVNLF